ncbi:MAG: hypothetical protein ABI323_05845 [Solirubrobacteraceae bacterium]
MALDAQDPSPLDIDLLTAALRADISELGTFVEVLAVKLEEAVPGAVGVERRRDGLFGPKLVRRIALDAGGMRLELTREGEAIETSCSRLSGGIVLKRDALETDAWLQRMGEALAEQAARSRTTRQALERLLSQ